MSKGAIVWLIAAASLVLIGCVILVGVMTNLEWDFMKLSTNKYETNDHEINEEFLSVLIDTNTADIKLLPSEDSKCRVECYEQKNLTHSVSVNDGELLIKVEDTRAWYEHIGINFGEPKITVYLPKTEYSSLTVKGSTGDVDIPNNFKFGRIDISVSTGDVTNYASADEDIKIKTTTGKIFVEDVSAGRLDLSVSTGTVTVSETSVEGDISVEVSTGKTKLTNVTCKDLFSDGDTGDIDMVNLIAEGTLSVERSTGDVKFDGCDASEIFVETDTGDVKGSLLSEKLFITETDTGRVEVPHSVEGGRCEISTDTGDIKISIK